MKPFKTTCQVKNAIILNENVTKTCPSLFNSEWETSIVQELSSLVSQSLTCHFFSFPHLYEFCSVHINVTWFTQLTEKALWDVVAVDAHTVNVLPYTNKKVMSSLQCKYTRLNTLNSTTVTKNKQIKWQTMKTNQTCPENKSFKLL